jgi:hypothetical protein
MREQVTDAGMSAPRKKITSPSFFTGNEVIDVFLPIMGADCFTVYGYFKRIEFTSPKLTHSVRAIANATKIDSTTVFRSLEILKQLGLIKLTRFRGSRGSECQLIDSRELAISLGAEYHRETVSFSLSPEVANRLIAQIKALREKQQSKSPATAQRGAPYTCGNLLPRVSQRNASVSPAKRQCPTRETQMGTHLIREERRIEEDPSRSPSHIGEVESPERLSNEDGLRVSLKWAADRFNGVIDDIRAHLLDTNRPPNPHLTNGFADWQESGFNSLAVEAAAWRGTELALALSASEPAATQSGLKKYHSTWNASLRKWFECVVQVELRQAQRK